MIEKDYKHSRHGRHNVPPGAWVSKASLIIHDYAIWYIPHSTWTKQVILMTYLHCKITLTSLLAMSNPCLFNWRHCCTQLCNCTQHSFTLWLLTWLADVDMVTLIVHIWIQLLNTQHRKSPTLLFMIWINQSSLHITTGGYSYAPNKHWVCGDYHIGLFH